MKNQLTERQKRLAEKCTGPREIGSIYHEGKRYPRVVVSYAKGVGELIQRVDSYKIVGDELFEKFESFHCNYDGKLKRHETIGPRKVNNKNRPASIEKKVDFYTPTGELKRSARGIL